MPSPPKPWEVNNANSGTAVVNPSNTITTSSNVPDVPARSSLNDSTTTPTRPITGMVATFFFLLLLGKKM